MAPARTRTADARAGDDGEDLVRLMAVLSDRTRLRILLALAGGETNVKTLCARLRCRQPTVSHHLALLRAGALVAPRRQGREKYYALGPRARSPSPGAVEVAAGGSRVRVTVPLPH